MPDLSSGYDIPNPFGLAASVFEFDMTGYRIALGYLSDLAGGTIESDALKTNGGTVPMLRSWQRSDRFRRVHDKCRRAGDAERLAAAARERAKQYDKGADTEPQGQHFVPLEDMPAQRSAFSLQPGRDSWGTA